MKKNPLTTQPPEGESVAQVGDPMGNFIEEKLKKMSIKKKSIH